MKVNFGSKALLISTNTIGLDLFNLTFKIR